MTPIPVVAAVIERDGRFLLGRRPAEKRHGGLWEFPGGKVDDGETVARAARRELEEELALAVLRVGGILQTVHDVGDLFAIHFHRVEVAGEPQALEHQAIGWFTLEELKGMPLAPADEGFVRWLGEEAEQT